MPFSSRDFWVLGSRLRVSCHRETSWEIKTDNPFSRWAGCCLHTEGRGWVVFVNRTPGKHWGISGGSGSGELNQIIRQVTERCVSVSPCLSVYEKILMETLTLKQRGDCQQRGGTGGKGWGWGKAIGCLLKKKKSYLQTTGTKGSSMQTRNGAQTPCWDLARDKRDNLITDSPQNIKLWSEYLCREGGEIFTRLVRGEEAGWLG